MLPQRSFDAWRFASICLLALTCMVGCDRSQPRASSLFNEKSSQTTRNDGPANAAGSADDLMLAAVFLRKGEAWFLKVAGPKTVIEPISADFESLAKSFSFAATEQKGDHPLWETPAGWKELPASGMRWATFIPANSGESTQISLIRLPRETPDSAAYLLANVNRWREQMQLPVWNEEDLREALGDNPLGDNTAHFFQIEGSLSGEITAGMAASPSANGAQAAGIDGTKAPSSHGALQSMHNSQPGSDAARLKFTAPENWRQGPAAGMRAASFAVLPHKASNDSSEGGNALSGAPIAEVTVIRLPKEAGDVNAVINLWRMNVGLAELPDQQAAESATKMETPAGAAYCVELISPGKGETPESSEPTSEDKSTGKDDIGVLGAIIPKDNEAWFVKLTGSADSVVVERERFKVFLQTLAIE